MALNVGSWRKGVNGPQIGNVRFPPRADLPFERCEGLKRGIFRRVGTHSTFGRKAPIPVLLELPMAQAFGTPKSQKGSSCAQSAG